MASVGQELMGPGTGMRFWAMAGFGEPQGCERMLGSLSALRR